MKRAVTGLLILGALQCAVYCWALRSGEYRGIGCCDQWCYAQGARRIVEGHPFSYSVGLPPTMGQTSVLYPFILAVPMAMGAEGQAIHDVSLILACVFYLAFLFAWGVVIVRVLPSGPGRAAAVAIFGLSGSFAYVAFTQCDQGLWMALSAAIAATMVCRRWNWTIALLVLAPWVRPEGMMTAVAMAAVGFIRKERRWRSLLPLVSVAGVFALNYALTGDLQFSSVSGKGYTKHFPLITAAMLTAWDGLAICASYLCSIPVPALRLFSMPSPVAALGFWIGLFALVRRRTKWSSAAFVFTLAALAGCGSVAFSGAVVDFDRYLAWLLPLPLLVAAFGTGLLTDRISSQFWRKLPLVALIATTLFSTVSLAAMMRDVSSARGVSSAEVRAEASRLPADALVGSDSFVWAYDLPPTVRYRETAGIFTPEFSERASSLAANGRELLKHDPSVRFDFWADDPLEVGVDSPRKFAVARVLFGEPLVPGNRRIHLHRADWSAYDRAAESPLKPLEPTARLDVCFLPDERAARLRGLSLERGEYIRAISAALREKDRLPMADCCMVVVKGQEFTLPTRPGVPAKLVVRTLGELYFRTGTGDYVTVGYGARVELTVTVGGRRLGVFAVPVDREAYTDFVIDIPAECFVSSETVFRIEGEFAAFGYWLYQ